MADAREISVEQAREFTAEHWPAHNRQQGIEWKQSDHAVGAFDGNACLGVAIYRVVGGMAFLEQIVVADGYTRRGIGSHLLRAVEVNAAELGCHVVQLETAETQAPEFYERHGYTRIGTWPNGRFHLEWYLYRKEL